MTTSIMHTIYRDFIIDLYKNPLNKRKLADADITASGANVACGDRVRMYAKTSRNVIKDCSFEGEGCAISIASASLLTEYAKGKSKNEILKLKPKDMAKWLDIKLGPGRIKCGLLCLETLQQGL